MIQELSGNSSDSRSLKYIAREFSTVLTGGNKGLELILSNHTLSNPDSFSPDTINTASSNSTNNANSGNGLRMLQDTT